MKRQERAACVTQETPSRAPAATGAGKCNPPPGGTSASSKARTQTRDVPDAILRFLERSLPDGPVPRQIRIIQHGQMWKSPTARPLRFTAIQLLSVERVAFSWRGRFPIAGPLAIKVLDEYSHDEGRLVVRLLGYPLDRQEGPETATGEAIRYLAELPFVPFAMAHNPDLAWREVDDRAAEVGAIVRGERLVVRFDFDATGDIVRASSK